MAACLTESGRCCLRVQLGRDHFRVLPSAIVSTSFDFLSSGYAFTLVSIFVKYYVSLFCTKSLLILMLVAVILVLVDFPLYICIRLANNACNVLIKNTDILIFFQTSLIFFFAPTVSVVHKQNANKCVICAIFQHHYILNPTQTHYIQTMI